MNACKMDPIKNRIATYWNWRSSSYQLDGDKSIETVKDWESAINALVSPVKGNHLTALDVGTGPGQLAFYLARKGFQATGIDISAGMVDRARQKARELGLCADFQTGDAENLAFEDNTFDVVVTRNLVWTLPNPEAAIQEWHRVLKPGGRIIISDGYWRNTTWARLPALALKLATGLLRSRSLISCRFFSHYAGLIRSLPLYEGVTSKDAGRLMHNAGFNQVLSWDIRRHFRINPYGAGQAPRFFIVYANK